MAIPDGQKMTASMFDEMGMATDPATDPHLFMTQHGLDETAFREALTEYRNLDTGWVVSPWAPEIGVLATDFINWFRWERL